MAGAMTRHATMRRQQRAVPTVVLDLLHAYGACVRHQGADVLYFDKKGRKRLAGDCGGDRNLRALEPFLNTYTAVADDGAIITVGRRSGRFRRP